MVSTGVNQPKGWGAKPRVLASSATTSRAGFQDRRAAERPAEEPLGTDSGQAKEVEMTRARCCFPMLSLMVALLAMLPEVGDAQLILNADNALSERMAGRTMRLGSDNLAFMWELELPMATTVYGVAGVCQREDAFGFLLGANKATFRNVTLIGLDSDNELTLTKTTVKLRRGLPKNVAVWEVTGAVQDLFGTDSAVLVLGRVILSKNVSAGDLVTCGLAVIEIDDSMVAQGANQEERLLLISEMAQASAFRSLTRAESRRK
jgi:hypothetical protein